jgi:hypothetical protein
MLDLNDNKWKDLKGGYKILYDASEVLKKLKEPVLIKEYRDLINELGDELHHQGDVELASYYAIPHLINIANLHDLTAANILSLINTIIIASNNNNPDMPLDIKIEYDQYLIQIGTLGKKLIAREWDLELASTSLAAIAISKKQIELAKAIIILEDQSTLNELLETY